MNRYILLALDLFFLAFLASCEPQVPVTPEEDIDLSSLPYGLSGYSLTDKSTPKADEPCVIYYKAGDGFPFSGYTEVLYAHIGIVEFEWKHVPADWNTNLERCRFTGTDVPDVWMLRLEPSIREWFGASSAEVINKIGVVVRNADGTRQTADLFCTVEDQHGTAYDEVEHAAMPVGASEGINYIDEHTVTLVLKDRDSQGGSYDHAYVIGDFSNWEYQSAYAMKRDEEAGTWWYTFEQVEPGKEYRFQYHLHDAERGTIRICDPYTEIVYSADDHWIPASTYPDMPAYPTATSGLVGAFQTARESYAWQANFTISNPDDLIIYELLLRDFSSTKDLKGALARLDYLEALGINAIELMPVQEFDGNNSWGYNPCAYFAMDKAYGTREMYKQFIDECHSRGIAVLLDVVYNHATGAHPMAKLYWNTTGNCTAADNPWFNVTAPHPYSVFHDWNHENAEVREHVKRNLEYLLREYRFDGFRFDLTKGFTQRKCTEATASNYDQGRIDVLTEYHDAIKAVNSEAVVILEHFCCDAEERALAEEGIKVWRNLNNSYCQSAMGYVENSSFSGLWTGTSMPFGSYVGFMESHDEERLIYKAKTWGAGIIAQSLNEQMQRAAMGAAFFFTVPGPKMIWQFGELGYDYSIEENGRTGEKPLRWDYLEMPERRALYDAYAQLITFRREHPQFFTSEADFTWKVSTSYWSTGRHISCVAGEEAFVVVGNPDTREQAITVTFPIEGSWRNYFESSESYTGTTTTVTLGAGEYRLFLIEN